jgi:hypothetical protein
MFSSEKEFPGNAPNIRRLSMYLITSILDREEEPSKLEKSYSHLMDFVFWERISRRIQEAKLT